MATVCLFRFLPYIYIYIYALLSLRGIVIIMGVMASLICCLVSCQHIKRMGIARHALTFLLIEAPLIAGPAAAGAAHGTQFAI